MRSKSRRSRLADELVLATGLIWGHLNAQQYEEAWRLSRGCLRIWPDAVPLLLMHAYAAAEVLEPFDQAKLLAFKNEGNAEWIALVLRRAAGKAPLLEARQAGAKALNNAMKSSRKAAPKKPGTAKPVPLAAKAAPALQPGRSA